jgi:hypothetical protein
LVSLQGRDQEGDPTSEEWQSSRSRQYPLEVIKMGSKAIIKMLHTLFHKIWEKEIYTTRFEE